jgi:tungstate transport system substrate-binding protein
MLDGDWSSDVCSSDLHVKAALAQQFADWVVSPAGQANIANYKINGEQLFFANAGK